MHAPRCITGLSLPCIMTFLSFVEEMAENNPNRPVWRAKRVFTFFLSRLYNGVELILFLSTQMAKILPLELGVATITKLSNYTIFYKAALFISVLIFSHNLTEQSVILISYITDTWANVGLLKATSIVNFQEGFTGVMVLVLDHIATAFFGPFKMVLLSTVFYVIGLVLLWLQEPANKVSTFYVAVVLIALGKAGRKPLLKAFLADQLRNNREEEERVEASTNIWWGFWYFLGSLLVIFEIGGFSWTKAFKMTAIVMGVGLAISLVGFNIYHHESPIGSPLTTLYMVLKVAISNMHITYPHHPNAYYMNDDNDIQLSSQSQFLRLLDKAAIIDTGTSSLSPEEKERKGKLCKAIEVKQVKLLLRTVPMWSTLLVYCLVTSTGTTFFFEQATNLDDRIVNDFRLPSAFFMLVQSFSHYAISYLYSVITIKWWPNNVTSSTQLIRIGLGMLCSFFCCVTARFVEVRRLKLVTLNGYLDDKDGIISMSVFWLTPQFCLLGLMEGLVQDGFSEFFYDQVGESMERHGPAFSEFVLGIGKFVSIFWILTFRNWIGHTINYSRLDNYYAILAILVIANAFFFGHISKMYVNKGARSETAENILSAAC